MPIHKRLVIDNLEGIAKRTPSLGLIGLKLSMLLSRENTVINTLVPKISQKNPKLEGYAWLAQHLKKKAPINVAFLFNSTT